MAEIIEGSKGRNLTYDLQALLQKLPADMRAEQPSQRILGDPDRFTLWVCVQHLLNKQTEINKNS